MGCRVNRAANRQAVCAKPFDEQNISARLPCGGIAQNCLKHEGVVRLSTQKLGVLPGAVGW